MSRNRSKTERITPSLDLSRLITVETSELNAVITHLTNLAQSTKEISSKILSDSVKLKSYRNFSRLSLLRSA